MGAAMAGLRTLPKSWQREPWGKVGPGFFKASEIKQELNFLRTCLERFLHQFLNNIPMPELSPTA